MVQVTEVELVLAARSGNKAAFGRLVEQHLSMVHHIAKRLVENQELAWELAQDAFLQAYLSLAKLREPASFQPWLHSIVRNVCRSHLRNQQHITYSWEAFSGESQLPAMLHPSAGDPQSTWEIAERNHQIQTALATLSAKNRSVLWLFYFEQLSIAEIAAQLDVSVNAVKGRLHQSRKQLRVQLASLVEPVDHPMYVAIAAKERNKGMSKITDLRLLPHESAGYNLYLFDTTSARVLQMFIGPDEGWQIQQYLAHTASLQLPSYNYSNTILNAIGVQLHSVRIERLQQFLFYAIVQLQHGEQNLEVEARPGDAIINALHAGSPIYVSNTVMASNGLSLPQPIDIDKWLYTEADAFVNVQQRTSVWSAKLFDEDDHIFTVRARTVFKHTVSIAKEHNHNYIGTEHLLSGLLQEGGTTAHLLHAAGATPAKIKRAIDQVGRGQESPLSEPTIVPRLVQVLDYAAAAKEQSSQPFIDAEHLLLGLLREGHGMAMTILHELGVDSNELQTRLIEGIQSNSQGMG